MGKGIGQRWEDGDPHDPRSESICLGPDGIFEIDFQEADDYFCWKYGGDGDNGETLLYALDVHFERLDRRRAARPPVVVLVGSTRFGEAFREARLRETLAGKIVLTVGCDWASDGDLGLSPETKATLDAVYLHKVEMADEVLVLDVGGYVGESTAREVAHARSLGKRVRYLSEEGS